MVLLGLGNDSVYSTVVNTHMHFGNDDVYIMYGKDIMSIYDPIAEIPPTAPPVGDNLLDNWYQCFASSVVLVPHMSVIHDIDNELEILVIKSNNIVAICYSMK